MPFMEEYRVGYCITSHGFGHAARSIAVMEALSRLVNVHFTLAGMVPEWFFRSSYSGPFSTYPVQTDVGLVQVSAMEVDLPATVRELHDFYPLRRERLDKLAAIFSDCHLVISDIAPIGISAARLAGVPSVLIENFTWDWIYEGYLAACPELNKFTGIIKELYRKADYHIQAGPVCNRSNCDLLTAPVARKVRNTRGSVRRKLEVGKGEHLVLVSMGGEGIRHLPVERLRDCTDTIFLVPRMRGTVAEQENLRFLPDNSGFFHPDLVAASDAVIGKVGYSTLAEVYHAGVPFGYVRRRDFRESGPLVQFIDENMSGIEITAEEFINGNWIAVLPELFSMKPTAGAKVNGADQCADLIASLLRI